MLVLYSYCVRRSRIILVVGNLFLLTIYLISSQLIYTCQELNLVIDWNDGMEHSIWKESLLESVAQLGEEGRAAVDFVRIHKTKINFKRVRANIGAFWTVFGNINLNSLYYTYDTSFDDLRIKTLVIHEARHLRQGIMTALSVYGELDAWQLEFGIYHRVKGVYPHKVIEELMSLPLGYDRPTLRKAVQLMQAYAGKGYRADLLPLFPWKKEIKYWLTRR